MYYININYNSIAYHDIFHEYYYTYHETILYELTSADIIFKYNTLHGIKYDGTINIY